MDFALTLLNLILILVFILTLIELIKIKGLENEAIAAIQQQEYAPIQ